MPVLPDWAIQVLQVVVILALAPLITGIIARVEAIIQQRRGPRLLQPYYDIAKLLQKETVLPGAGRAGVPRGAVRELRRLRDGPAADPGADDVRAAAGVHGRLLRGRADPGVGELCRCRSRRSTRGSPYAQLGSSRLRSFGAFNEPTVIFVTFVLALTTHTDLPYAFGATIRSSTVEVFRPSHLLMIAAFFMLVLIETGRIPVENHGGTLEFGQIEEARVAEHSGPGLAFLRWGSSVKQLLLFTILMNVLVAPWGMASSGHLGVVLAAIGLLVLQGARRRRGGGRDRVELRQAAAVQDPRVHRRELHARGAGGRDLPVRARATATCI